MRALIRLGLYVFLFVPAISAAGSPLTAEEILRKVDQHRLISNNCEMSIRVQSHPKNPAESSIVMKGTINDGKMTTLLFLEPPNMKGRTLLIKENEMWLEIPNVKNPIRLTPHQRLVGGISFGDIAGVSFTDGYSAKLKGEESTEGMRSDGSEAGVGNCFVLDLTAKDSGANYHKIIVWVEERGLMPVKADLFALSGKRMMTLYFTAPMEYNGRKLITKIFMFDQVDTTKHFSMEYFEIKTLQ